MDQESCIFHQVLTIMASFQIANFMGMGCIYTNQKITILAIGRIIELKDMDSFITMKELCIKANGEMIINKGQGKNIGLMELILEDIFLKDRKYQENLNGQKKAIMMASL